VTAAGGAWNASIVSEYVQVHGETRAAFGLGSIISQATARGNFPLLAASVLAMAVSVVLVNHLFWRRLYRLAQRRYALET
jgi:NitT/TauT family transport system permease protein